MARFLTTTQAAQELGLCRETVRRRIAAGELRAVRIGGRLLIAREQLDALARAAGGTDAAIADTPTMDAGNERGRR